MRRSLAKTREEARRLYLTSELQTNAEIAKRLGVKPHTVGRWRSDEDWDSLRLKIDHNASEMFAEKIATDRVTLNVRHYRMWELLVAKLADELKAKQGIPIRELETDLRHPRPSTEGSAPGQGALDQRGDRGSHPGAAGVGEAPSDRRVH